MIVTKLQNQYFNDTRDAVRYARAVLGADFVAPDEIGAVVPGAIYSPEQVIQLTSTIPPKEVLHSLKQNEYALMPQPPSARNLLALREKMPHLFYKPHWYDCWRDSRGFIKNDLTGTGWLMTKKVPVGDSGGKYLSEQLKLLSHPERVPNAPEMGWFITTFFAVRGIRLFEDGFVRTSSCDHLGRRILVGCFDEIGLRINFWWDTHRFDRVGLASALQS